MSDQPMPPMTPRMQTAQPQGPVKTGLAVTTLVLGIVSLFVCLLLGIVAIITGIIAINRASSAPHLHGGRGMAIAGLVCGSVSLLLTPVCVSILLPSLSRARELSKQLVCQSNMNGIETAMRIYQDDFPGQGVPSFDVFVSEGLLEPDHLLCPS